MELAPRYCRTCGSRILLKTVCHNCNNNPIKGDNYCYNCGALTPNADGCLRCGARYRKKSFIAPVLLIGLGLILAISAAAYFLNSDSSETSPEPKASNQTKITTAPPGIPSAQKPIINPVDTTKQLTTPQVDSSKIKINKAAAPAIEINTTDSAGKIKSESVIFTPDELKFYTIKCRYFEKGARSRVVFFTSGGSGYIKANGKIQELKRKTKGADVTEFGGSEYEASVTIDGLGGSEKEWLASCTLIIKNIAQNQSIKQTVYSSCIE